MPIELFNVHGQYTEHTKSKHVIAIKWTFALLLQPWISVLSSAKSLQACNPSTEYNKERFYKSLRPKNL